MNLIDDPEIIGLRLTADEWIAVCGLTSSTVPFVVSAVATALGLETEGNDSEAAAAAVAQRVAINSLLLRGYALVGDPVTVDPSVAVVVRSYQAATRVGQLLVRSGRGLEVIAEHVLGDGFEPLVLVNAGFGVEALRLRSTSESSLGDLCGDLTLEALRACSDDLMVHAPLSEVTTHVDEAPTDVGGAAALWRVIDTDEGVEMRSLAVSRQGRQFSLADELRVDSPVFKESMPEVIRDSVAALLGHRT